MHTDKRHQEAPAASAGGALKETCQGMTQDLAEESKKTAAAAAAASQQC